MTPRPTRVPRIVEDFVRLDDRIRLIRHERNLGLGGARNTGIAAARAGYVGGVDSDDWVGPTMFERLFKGTDGGRADVVEGGLIQIDPSGEVVWSYRPTPRVVENDQNQINIFEATRQAFYTKIWRRALFVDNDIWFPERLYFEDLATTPRLLAKAKRIHFIEDASYFYLKRDGSITFSASDKHQMDYFRVFDILLEFLFSNDLMDRYRNEFLKQISGHLSYHASNVRNFDLPEREKTQYLRHLLMMGSAYLEFRTPNFTGLQARIWPTGSRQVVPSRGRRKSPGFGARSPPWKRRLPCLGRTSRSSTRPSSPSGSGISIWCRIPSGD